MKNNILIANQTLQIIEAGSYNIGEKRIALLPGNYREVKVYTPDMAEELLKQKDFLSHEQGAHSCSFYLVKEDSFQVAGKYAHPLVMNFANAHQPGGAFRMGATAQEEALCRNSTLYASLTSDKAFEMYQYNRRHLSPTDSDYMLLSPEVCVFRDVQCDLLEVPYMVSVITLPAPNKRGAAMLISQKKIDMVMKRRIRIMLGIAAENNYQSLVLGAWGCGAFGHDARKVAGYFKEILVDEQYEEYFENVVFAILSGNKKLDAFVKVFGERIVQL